MHNIAGMVKGDEQADKDPDRIGGIDIDIVQYLYPGKHGAENKNGRPQQYRDTEDD